MLVALYAMALLFLWLGRTVAGSRSLAIALTLTIAIGVFPVGTFVPPHWSGPTAPSQQSHSQLASSFLAERKMKLLSMQAIWHW